MLMKKSVLAVVGCTVLALQTSVAQAQLGSASGSDRSSTQGFVIGLGLNGSSIEIDDADLGGDAQSGGGLNFVIGYNFTPNLGLFLNTSGANIDDDDDGYTLGQADLAVRYSFASPERAFAPYLEAGFTGIVARDDVDGADVVLSGHGFTGAIGLNYFFSRTVALDTNFRYTGGKFTTVEIDGEDFSDGSSVDVNTGRFNIGISFFP
jgi:opacity protein-like surface antigen